MTTIAAVRIADGCAMAADSLVSLGSETTLLAFPKLRKVAPWLVVGVCGGAFELKWMRSLPIDSESNPDSLDEAWALLDTTLPAWRARPEDDDLDGGALALTPWGIFELHAGGTQWTPNADVAALGSGSRFALGAMRALGDRRDAAWVAQRAVHIAASLDAYTGGQVVVETLDWWPRD